MLNFAVMKKTALYLFLLFSFFSLIIHAQVYNVSTIDSILKADANSVVRKDEMVVTINSVDQMTVKSSYALTIFNKTGKKHLYLSQYYSPELKIKKLQATFYDKNGVETKKVKESKFKDYAAGSGYLTLAQDGRYKSYDFENANYPYTVQFDVEYVSSNKNYRQLVQKFFHMYLLP